MRMRKAIMLALLALLSIGLTGCPPKYVEPEIAPTVTKPTNEPATDNTKTKAGKAGNEANPSRNE
ncbi:MAG: hypothetical protein HZB16_16215 [Armatimonadetes bacterium]|nr:hypothetical protein [Armatimonadota bacterium]